MRKAIGWLLFVVGVGILGWWARGHQAVEIQSQIGARAEHTAASFAVGEIAPIVSGRDITLRGVVLEDDHRQVFQSFDDIKGRRLVRSELELAKYFGPNFTAEFNAGTGLLLQGSTTSEVDGKVVATLMTVPLAVDKLNFDSAGEFGVAKGKLGAIGKVLPELDNAEITVVGDQVGIAAQVVSGKDQDAITRSLRSGLGADDRVEVSLVQNVNDGDIRTNVWTGELQVFASAAGRWLPAVNFDVNLANCQQQTDKLLAANKILFVTGSAELDASSTAAIDALAGTFRHCLGAGDLSLVLGGHTDSDGDDAANLSLSKARAQAVVDALAALGIAADKIAARGYGETQPIAENDTDEGKAANRRTTIIWSTN